MRRAAWGRTAARGALRRSAALADGAGFYADNKRVSIAKAKAELGFAPAYPTYREGLKALAEAGEGRT